MKRVIFAALVIFTVCVNAHSQRRPLRGSGKVITQTYSYKDFDKIQLKDLNGEINIEVGKPFAISISIDDNLANLLGVSVINGKLTVELKDNERNRMYIEDTHIKINISLPEISVLQHNGNSNLMVIGISGRYFRLENSGNGDIKLNGSIDAWDLSKTGNGDLTAVDFIVKKATINSSGNGDAKINVTEKLVVTISGNGDLVNKGQANFEVLSKTGNGELIKQ
jgi:Putative auto-transporter adhesin, head GIN domain